MLSLEHGTAENILWKSNFEQICFQFFTKGVHSFNCNMELIPNCWRSHSENIFANIQLSFRNKTLFKSKPFRTGSLKQHQLLLQLLRVLTMLTQGHLTIYILVISVGRPIVMHTNLTNNGRNSFDS